MNSIIFSASCILLLLFQAVFACELFQLQSNNTHLLPKPLVNIDYNVNTDSFSFSVKTPYLRDSTTWVIDFQPWNNFTRKIQIPANCENRVASSFAATALSEHWKSAPFADSQDALGTMQYLAYGPGNGWEITSPSCNQVHYQRNFPVNQLIQCSVAPSSGTVNNTNSYNSTMARNLGNSLISVKVIPLTPFIQYSGTLHVTAVAPVYENETIIVGYNIISAYKYPFAFKLNTIIKDIEIIGSAKEKYELMADKLRFKREYNSASIEYTLRTIVKSSNGDFLQRPTVAAKRYPIFVMEKTLYEKSANQTKNATRSEPVQPQQVVEQQTKREAKGSQYHPSCTIVGFGDQIYQSCVQEWFVYSSIRAMDQLATSATGSFTLVWSVVGCAADDTNAQNCQKIQQAMPFVAQYRVASTVVEKHVDLSESVALDQLSLDTVPRMGSSVKITSHKTMLDATKSSNSLEGSFGGQIGANATDRIFVKQSRITKPSQHQISQASQVKIHNVWLCFTSDETQVPVWDPSKNLTGCAKPIDNVLPVHNIRLLVKDSLPFYSENDAFEPAVHELDNNSHITIFSFNQKPLTFQSAVYYVHVEYEVVEESELVLPSHKDGLSLEGTMEMQNHEVQIHAFYVEQVNWPLATMEQEMNNSASSANFDGVFWGSIIATVSIVGVTGAAATVIVAAVGMYLLFKYTRNSKKRNSTELLRANQIIDN